MRLISPDERLAQIPRGPASHRLSYAPRLDPPNGGQYIHLKCGHLTTRAEVDFYSVFQATPHRYYCTQAKCQTWVDELRPEKSPDPIQPDELPF